jgi:hypothetical protein
LTYKDLFAVQPMIAQIWGLELSPKFFMKMRRFDKALGEELKTFDPERAKLFNRHSQFIKDGRFFPPKEEDEGFAEFIKDYNEVFDIAVDIPWENEDVAAIEKKIEDGGKDVVGKDAKVLLDIIETFNAANDAQKKEPVAVVDSIAV